MFFFQFSCDQGLFKHSLRMIISFCAGGQITIQVIAISLRDSINELLKYNSACCVQADHMLHNT